MQQLSLSINAWLPVDACKYLVITREDDTAVTAEQRLAALRARLAAAGLDGMLIPRADEHLGEHVPASAERLAWLTGFTGSAGMAIVLWQRAAIFTDGRYTLQVTQQTDPGLWERRHLTEESGQQTVDHERRRVCHQHAGLLQRPADRKGCCQRGVVGLLGPHDLEQGK